MFALSAQLERAGLLATLPDPIPQSLQQKFRSLRPGDTVNFIGLAVHIAGSDLPPSYRPDIHDWTVLGMKYERMSDGALAAKICQLGERIDAFQ